MDNKSILGALAMDLKRVALGLHRGSSVMADRFFLEVMKRKNEIPLDTVPPYMQKILRHLDSFGTNRTERTAEDALMYSTLIQNYAVQKE